MRQKILVVEDDADYRQLVAEMLQVSEELSGSDILQAENGDAAVSIMMNESIHLLVTDLAMPVMDGLELLDWMRNHSESFQRTPAIILSGDPESLRKSDKWKDLNDRVFILEKPVQHDQLVRLLRILSNKSKKESNRGAA